MKIQTTLKFFFCLLIVLSSMSKVYAADPAPPAPSSDTLGIPTVGCAPKFPGNASTTSYCDPSLLKYYEKIIPGDNGNNIKYVEKCAEGQTFQEQYEDFKKDPAHTHLWVEDPEITAQGKADERARQFLYWVLSHPSIDDHPTIKNVWNFSRSIALFLTLFIASIFGLGIIVAQRQNFDLKVEVSPLIFKLVMMLLYITFSASLLLTMIQVSEIIMKFFIENLGGKDLFNIYFSTNSGEKNYIGFIGCRDLNIRVQEGVNAELFMLRATNVTYYIMGVMILLRKILLWFLLFVSPFLALLMPFVFIRNIGWIWIGVFFQWLFYGPLFALFLGALAQIWKKGIPFPFNFSRVNTFEGYVFPTGINIAYGGPGQEWDGLTRVPQTNNGNYIDTFAEYIITLIMLWAVTFFPWWLLRIFRDYCCEGILAMKNILLQMYDQMRSPPPTSPSGPTPNPSFTFTGTALKVPMTIEQNIKTKFSTLEEVRQVRTEEISKSLNLTATKLTDVAHFETNKTTQETVKKNIEYLQNPMKATNGTDRQKFMNIRTELFNRSVKEDRIARQILSATSSSRVDQMEKRQEITKSIPAMQPVTHIISVKFNVPQQKIQSVTSSFMQSVTNNTTAVNTISQMAQVTQQQTQTILQKFTQHTNQPTNNIVNTIAKDTNIEKEKVVQVLQQTNNVLNSQTSDTKMIEHIQNQTGLNTQQVKYVVTAYKKLQNQPIAAIEESIQKNSSIEKEKINKAVEVINQTRVTSQNIIKEVAQKENIKESQVQQIIQSQVPLVTETEKNIEQAVSIPSNVSLEDYEEVKKMWQEQYEDGEVPVSENIQSRHEWLDTDIVLITNTLNKLLSVDETVRNEGLDDVGYLLPIFMVNNLSGEELLVYLKAKLEAAKAVLKLMNKKEEVKEEEPEEEIFVDAQKKKEEAKTMQLEQAQELPEEEAPKTPEQKAEDATLTPSEPTQEAAPITPTDEKKEEPPPTT